MCPPRYFVYLILLQDTYFSLHHFQKMFQTNNNTTSTEMSTQFSAIILINSFETPLTEICHLSFGYCLVIPYAYLLMHLFLGCFKFTVTKQQNFRQVQNVDNKLKCI